MNKKAISNMAITWIVIAGISGVGGITTLLEITDVIDIIPEKIQEPHTLNNARVICNWVINGEENSACNFYEYNARISWGEPQIFEGDLLIQIGGTSGDLGDQYETYEMVKSQQPTLLRNREDIQIMDYSELGVDNGGHFFCNKYIICFYYFDNAIENKFFDEFY